MLSSLSDEEEQLLCEITDAMEEYGDLQTRPRLKCISYQMTQRLEPFLAKANKILKHVSTSDLLGTNILLYAVAKVLTSKILGSPYVSSNTTRSKQLPPWKVRLQSKVQLL